MRTLTGILVGVVGYAAWKLSEPGPGEPAEIGARVHRLRDEWRKATEQGKVAGEQKRRQMETELDAIFQQRPHRPMR